jgi:hypothetical protein
MAGHDERLRKIETNLGASSERRKITLKVVYTDLNGRAIEDSTPRETPSHAEFPNGSILGVSWPPKGQGN